MAAAPIPAAAVPTGSTPRTVRSNIADHSDSPPLSREVTNSHWLSNAHWSTGLRRGREGLAQTLSGMLRG